MILMKRTILYFILRFAGVPRWIARLILLATMLAGFGVGSVWAQSIEGRVVRVADGDTITVLDAGNRQHRIRLKGIDAPESKQAFGNVSRQTLADMVAGRQVRVRADATDRYGRVLGVIFVDGRDANLEMVRAGMAWHYTQYQRDQSAQERSAYAAAEAEARATRRGLWRDANPVPPWDFRRNARNEQ